MRDADISHTLGREHLEVVLQHTNRALGRGSWKIQEEAQVLSEAVTRCCFGVEV